MEIELGKNNTKPSSQGSQWKKIEDKLSDEIEKMKNDFFEDNSIKLKKQLILEISIFFNLSFGYLSVIASMIKLLGINASPISRNSPSTS